MKGHVYKEPKVAGQSSMTCQSDSVTGEAAAEVTKSKRHEKGC